MKRVRAAKETARTAASDAYTALRISRELKEDGDAEAATSCVEHAVGRACLSATLANLPLMFDEASLPPPGDGPPPAALLASAGLATLGALRKAASILEAARAAYEESLRIWPGAAVRTQCVAWPCRSGQARQRTVRSMAGW